MLAAVVLLVHAPHKVECLFLTHQLVVSLHSFLALRVLIVAKLFMGFTSLKLFLFALLLNLQLHLLLGVHLASSPIRQSRANLYVLLSSNFVKLRFEYSATPRTLCFAPRRAAADCSSFQSSTKLPL
mmetsp:Transcript_21219/g.37343  ORF Transcript_21219/g.37343 Transcript_21219/m.37343 type:complete len:127 (+) Transcript_21219:812-1192(+)